VAAGPGRADSALSPIDVRSHALAHKTDASLPCVGARTEITGWEQLPTKLWVSHSPRHGLRVCVSLTAGAFENWGQ